MTVRPSSVSIEPAVAAVAAHEPRRDADDAALFDQVQRAHFLDAVERVHRRAAGIAGQQEFDAPCARPLRAR